MSILLLILSFLLPVCFKAFRTNLSNLICIWIVILSHQIIAMTNAFYVSLIGSKVDAVNFFYNASQFAENAHAHYVFSTGALFYEQSLGLLFKFFGTSLLLGSEFSIIAFVLSVVVLSKMIKLLDMDKCLPAIILVFGLLPSVLFNTSTTLREAYEILFVMLTCFFLLKLVLSRSPIYFLLIVLSSSLMARFHYALVSYAFFIIGFSYYFYLLAYYKNRKTILAVLIGLPVTLFVILMITVFLYPQLISTSIGSILNFRDAAIITELNASAFYGTPFVVTSLFGFLLSAGNIYAHYLLSPFPWKVSDFLSLYASAAAVFKLFLLVCSLYFWKQSRGKDRILSSMLLFVFFTLSLVWAFGTINYGTALRHHVTTYWILALLGVSGLMRFVER